MKPNKVTKKKKELEETKKRVLEEIQESVKKPTFGIEGVGMVGNNQIDPFVDPR